MVHKSPPRRIRPQLKRLPPPAPEAAPVQAKRGRPRAYDPQTALRRAAETFWDSGFAATSMDDLSQATGMNRPSLYAAFGDKQAIYAQALAAYRRQFNDALEAALNSETAIRSALLNAYRAALDIFCAGAHGPRGCFILGTAMSEAVLDRALRKTLAADLADWDTLFAARLRDAKNRGELGAKADPDALAQFAAAILHSLALRARTGASRAELDAMAAAAVALICETNKEAKPLALFGTY
jgi:AcrR family transcriptional regulator